MTPEEPRNLVDVIQKLEEFMNVALNHDPLLPSDFREKFIEAKRELDQRRTFNSLKAALSSEEYLGEYLVQVGLGGEQLQAKLYVIGWYGAQWRQALQDAEGAEAPEDESDTGPDGGNEPAEEDGNGLWKRARKKLVKVLDAIDVALGSVISALTLASSDPQQAAPERRRSIAELISVSEAIREAKDALKIVLDR